MKKKRLKKDFIIFVMMGTNIIKVLIALLPHLRKERKRKTSFLSLLAVTNYKIPSIY